MSTDIIESPLSEFLREIIGAGYRVGDARGLEIWKDYSISSLGVVCPVFGGLECFGV